MAKRGRFDVCSHTCAEGHVRAQRESRRKRSPFERRDSLAHTQDFGGRFLENRRPVRHWPSVKSSSGLGQSSAELITVAVLLFVPPPQDAARLRVGYVDEETPSFGIISRLDYIVRSISSALYRLSLLSRVALAAQRPSSSPLPTSVSRNSKERCCRCRCRRRCRCYWLDSLFFIPYSSFAFIFLPWKRQSLSKKLAPCFFYFLLQEARVNSDEKEVKEKRERGGFYRSIAGAEQRLSLLQAVPGVNSSSRKVVCVFGTKRVSYAVSGIIGRVLA